MPPSLCLRSNCPAFTGCAARIFSRMATISVRSAATSRGAVITASRTAAKRGARLGSPRMKRARVMA